MINVVREKHASGRVSIHASANDGEFILLPFRFAGSYLYLDFSTSPIGSIRVELQDFMGVAMKGYTLDDCLEIKGEGTENLVRWKQGHDVSAFAGQLIRMRFSMNNADLFSFRFKQ
jgi:hypothetical protein